MILKSFGAISPASSLKPRKADCEYRFGTFVTGLEENGEGVSVRFDDGKVETFALVICAEGISSSTREMVLAEQTHLRYLGAYMAFFNIPRRPRGRLLGLDGQWHRRNLHHAAPGKRRDDRLDDLPSEGSRYYGRQTGRQKAAAARCAERPGHHRRSHQRGFGHRRGFLFRADEPGSGLDVVEGPFSSCWATQRIARRRLREQAPPWP